MKNSNNNIKRTTLARFKKIDGVNDDLELLDGVMESYIEFIHYERKYINSHDKVDFYTWTKKSNGNYMILFNEKSILIYSKDRYEKNIIIWVIFTRKRFRRQGEAFKLMNELKRLYKSYDIHIDTYSEELIRMSEELDFLILKRD